MIAQNLGIFSRADEKRRDTRAEWNNCRVCNLQSNAKGYGHDDRVVTTSLVIAWGSELEVQICKQSRQIGNKGSTAAEHIRDERIVDQGIDTSLLDEAPSIFRCVEVALAKERNFDILANISIESTVLTPNLTYTILVEILKCPLQESSKALKETAGDGTDNAT